MKGLSEEKTKPKNKKNLKNPVIKLMTVGFTSIIMILSNRRLRNHFLFMLTNSGQPDEKSSSYPN